MISDKNIVVFDAETTGTSVTRDKIIQLSALKIDPHFNILEPIRKIFVNPMMPIPKEATEIHGITDEMVKDQPKFASYAKALFAFFDGCDLAGFNLLSFDIPLLSEEFNRVGIEWPYSLTNVFDAFNIFRAKEKRDLAAAVKFYTGETLEGAHDAGNDVLATMKVLQGQMNMYPDLQAMNAQELALFCTDGKKAVDVAGKIVIGKDGMPVYGFGKDEGKNVKLNPGFGEWMLKQDFCANTKKVVEGLIRGKKLFS